MAEETIFLLSSSFRYRVILLNSSVSFQFFVPQFEGVSFPYIVHWIASKPSTCTPRDLLLDVCPIKAVLEVINCAANYESTVQGSFLH